MQYLFYVSQFSSSVVSDSLRPRESQHARPPCPSPTPGVHSDTSIELVMPSSHLILGRPLLLLPPIPPSIRVFPSESTLRMRWPKYWSFSFSIIPPKELPGLISYTLLYTSKLFLSSNTHTHTLSSATCFSESVSFLKSSRWIHVDLFILTLMIRFCSMTTLKLV